MLSRIVQSLVVITAASMSALACTASSETPSSGAHEDNLAGCSAGKASSGIPSDGEYELTSFGFTPGADDGVMSCGDYTRTGSWYYAASRQRYGCGSRIQIEANGKCVVAQTDDYGPNVCVENAAHMPIIDASPLVSEHLFGVKSAGWSDHLRIHVTEVANTTPLGPCTASGGGGGGANGGGGGGAGDAGGGATCHSATLGRDVPERTCVQARSDRTWYQCTASGWVLGGASGAGPDGACASSHPL
jgi:hypothetical protein